MRVSAINKYSNVSYIGKNEDKTAVSKPDFKNKTELFDFNYGKSLINSSKISFKGNEATTNVSLSDKLFSAIYYLNSNDVVVCANSIEAAHSTMKEHLDKFHFVINNIIFVEDSRATNPFAFDKNGIDLFQIVNLGKEDIKVVNKGDEELIESGENLIIHTSDHFKIGKIILQEEELFAEDNDNLIRARKYLQKYKFGDNIAQDILRINNRSLDTLVPHEKKVKKTNLVTFADVGGQDHVISELKKTVMAPIKQPEFFKSTMLNRGIILYGKPGTGKSLIAKALANEVDAHFVKINASEMDSKWVGETEQNWKKLFDEAIEKQPAIIFIDEIDAISKKRGGNDVHGDKALNYVLSRISEINQNKENVFVIGATNNFVAMDAALIRSGRLGRHIEVDVPDLKGTEAIFDIHSVDEKISEDFDKKAFIQRLFNNAATGGDIAFIVNESRMNSFDRENIFDKILNNSFTEADNQKHELKQEDFDKAINLFESQNEEKRIKPVGFKNKQ